MADQTVVMLERIIIGCPWKCATKSFAFDEGAYFSVHLFSYEYYIVAYVFCRVNVRTMWRKGRPCRFIVYSEMRISDIFKFLNRCVLFLYNIRPCMGWAEMWLPVVVLDCPIGFMSGLLISLNLICRISCILYLIVEM